MHRHLSEPSNLVFSAGLTISTMAGDVVVWRGLSWVKQVVCRAQGSLHKAATQRLVNFHHAAGPARVSASAWF